MATEYYWKCKNPECKYRFRLTDGILFMDLDPDSPMQKSIENGAYGEEIKQIMSRFPKDRICFDRVGKQCPKCHFLCRRFTFKTDSPSFNHYVLKKKLHYPCPRCGQEMKTLWISSPKDYTRLPCPKCGGIMKRSNTTLKSD